MGCQHEDLMVDDLMITCLECGTIWRATPVYFMVDPTTAVHPDDVSYVYEPDTTGNVQASVKFGGR